MSSDPNDAPPGYEAALQMSDASTTGGANNLVLVRERPNMNNGGPTMNNGGSSAFVVSQEGDAYRGSNIEMRERKSSLGRQSIPEMENAPDSAYQMDGPDGWGGAPVTVHVEHEVPHQDKLVQRYFELVVKGRVGVIILSLVFVMLFLVAAFNLQPPTDLPQFLRADHNVELLRDAEGYLPDNAVRRTQDLSNEVPYNLINGGDSTITQNPDWEEGDDEWCQVFLYDACFPVPATDPLSTTAYTTASAPENVQVWRSDTVMTTLIIEWDPPSFNADIINSYYIAASFNGEQSWMPTVAQTRYNVYYYEWDNLWEHTDYTFRVVAKDINGKYGILSVPVTENTLSDAPLPPQYVSASALSADVVYITWNEPENEIGDILSYEVHRSLNVSFEDYEEVSMSSRYNNYAYDTYLCGGQTYYYRVYTSSVHGMSNSSNIDGATTYYGVPDAPILHDISKTTCCADRVFLNFTAPECANAGGPIEYFLASVYVVNETGVAAEYDDIVIDFNSNNAWKEEYAIGNLTLPILERDYYIAVRAVANNVWGNLSYYLTTDSFPQITIGTPPRHVSAMTQSASSIHLSWTDHEHDDIPPLLHTNVQMRNNGMWDTIATVDMPTLEYTVNGLVSGGNYTFRLYFDNKNGVSDYSHVFGNETFALLPVVEDIEFLFLAPVTRRLLSAPIKATNRVLLNLHTPLPVSVYPYPTEFISWSISDDGGDPVDTWELKLHDSEYAEDDYLLAYSGFEPECTIEFAYGRLYDVAVRAHNSAGWTEWSPSAELAIVTFLPEPPAATMTQTMWNEVEVTWSTPNDNGETISEYSVLCGSDVVPLVIDADSTNYVHTVEVEPGTEMTCHLTASNAEGVSTSMNTSTTTDILSIDTTAKTETFYLLYYAPTDTHDFTVKIRNNGEHDFVFDSVELGSLYNSISFTDTDYAKIIAPGHHLDVHLTVITDFDSSAYFDLIVHHATYAGSDVGDQSVINVEIIPEFPVPSISVPAPASSWRTPAENVTQTFTLTNNGNGKMHIDEILLEYDEVSITPTPPLTIRAGHEQDFTMLWNTTNLIGGNYTETVSFGDVTANHYADFEVTLDLYECILDLNVSWTLMQNGVYTYAQDEPDTVYVNITVTNTGYTTGDDASTCWVERSVSGDLADIADNVIFSVDQGASVEHQVIFPMSVYESGIYTGNITFESTLGTEVKSLNYSIATRGPKYALDWPEEVWGSIVVAPAPQIVTICNSGYLDSLNISYIMSSDNAVLTVSGSSIETITAGDCADLTFTYSASLLAGSYPVDINFGHNEIDGVVTDVSVELVVNIYEGPVIVANELVNEISFDLQYDTEKTIGMVISNEYGDDTLDIYGFTLTYGNIPSFIYYDAYSWSYYYYYLQYDSYLAATDSVPAGETITWNFTVPGLTDEFLLIPGEYTGVLEIMSNGANPLNATHRVSLDVMTTVTAPQVKMTGVDWDCDVATSCMFVDSATALPNQAELQISFAYGVGTHEVSWNFKNIGFGDEDLTIDASVLDDTPGISFAETSLNIPMGNSKTLTVQFDKENTPGHSAVLVLETNDPLLGPTLYLELNISVVVPELYVINEYGDVFGNNSAPIPTMIPHTSDGGIFDLNLDLINNGTTDVVFGDVISVNVSWLAVDIEAGDLLAHQTDSVYPVLRPFFLNSTALDIGMYHAEIILSCNAPVNNSIYIINIAVFITVEIDLLEVPGPLVDGVYVLAPEDLYGVEATLQLVNHAPRSISVAVNRDCGSLVALTKYTVSMPAFSVKNYNFTIAAYQIDEGHSEPCELEFSYVDDVGANVELVYPLTMIRYSVPNNPYNVTRVNHAGENTETITWNFGGHGLPEPGSATTNYVIIMFNETMSLFGASHLEENYDDIILQDNVYLVAYDGSDMQDVDIQTPVSQYVTVRVYAGNDVGFSQPGSLTFLTDGPLPNAITSMDATLVSNYEIEFLLDDTSNSYTNEFEGVLYYALQVRDVPNGGSWIDFNPEIESVSFTISLSSDLLTFVDGSTYDFRVAAVNRQGMGPYSNLLAVTIPNCAGECENDATECYINSGDIQCLCNVGYFGAFCEDSCAMDNDGRICGGDGVCNVETGDCECNDDNHVGPYCMPCPASDSGSACYGNGNCIWDESAETTVCDCDPNFVGDTCQECPICYIGECQVADDGVTPYCECERGFAGADCSLQCEDKCNLNGECVTDKFGDAVCECDDSHVGATCSSACPKKNDKVCNGHGECIYNDDYDHSIDGAICLCEDTHKGDTCEYSCPGYIDVDEDDLSPNQLGQQYPCDKNGECFLEEYNNGTGRTYCECSVGYSEEDCTQNLSERGPSVGASVDIYFYWGIKGIDMEDLRSTKEGFVGTPIFDSYFNLADRDSQVFMFEFCRDMVTDPELVDHMRPSSLKCPMLAFHEWLKTYNEVFPVSEHRFFDLFMTWLRGASGKLTKWNTMVGIEGDAVRWISVAGISYTQSSQGGVGLIPEYDFWEDFMKTTNKRAPVGLQTGWQYAEEWPRMIVELAFIEGTAGALGIALLTACVSIMLFTYNIILALLATVIMAMIIVCMLGFFVFMEWTLGAVEAVSLSIVIGMSVDYVLHLGHAYSNAPFDQRKERTNYAVNEIGYSILAASLTTMGAMVILLACEVYPFVVMGTIIMMTVLFAILFSLGTFVAMSLVMGPDHAQGVLTSKNLGARCQKYGCLALCRGVDEEEVQEGVEMGPVGRSRMGSRGRMNSRGSGMAPSPDMPRPFSVAEAMRNQSQHHINVHYDAPVAQVAQVAEFPEVRKPFPVSSANDHDDYEVIKPPAQQAIALEYTGPRENKVQWGGEHADANREAKSELRSEIDEAKSMLASYVDDSKTKKKKKKKKKKDQEQDLSKLPAVSQNVMLAPMPARSSLAPLAYPAQQAQPVFAQPAQASFAQPAQPVQASPTNELEELRRQMAEQQRELERLRSAQQREEKQPAPMPPVIALPVLRPAQSPEPPVISVEPEQKALVADEQDPLNENADFADELDF